MTVHLVTGHAGKIHVTSAEQAQYNAYVFGDGVYIISGCEATILNDNTVHIGDGTMLVQGRHVNVNSGGDDVTIKNGVAGQRRRDLICLTYTMDTGTGVEECAFTVVQGESGIDYVTPALDQQSILKGDNPCSVALYTVDVETDRTLSNIQQVCDDFITYQGMMPALIKVIQDAAQPTYRVEGDTLYITNIKA